MIILIPLTIVFLLEIERARYKKKLIPFYNTNIYSYLLYMLNSLIYIIYYNQYYYNINHLSIHKDFNINHEAILNEVEDALNEFYVTNPGIFDEDFEQNNDDYGYFVLKFYGMINTNICPSVRKLIQNNKIHTCFISIMDKELDIHEHRGPNAGLLRYHYTLLSANSKDDFLHVKKNKFYWKEKDGFLFDDTYRHYVIKKTNGMRISIICDFERDLIFPLSLLNRFILKYLTSQFSTKILQKMCIPEKKRGIYIEKN